MVKYALNSNFLVFLMEISLPQILSLFLFFYETEYYETEHQK